MAKFFRPRRSMDDIRIQSNGFEYTVQERCIVTRWGHSSEIWDDVGVFDTEYFPTYESAQRFAARLIGRFETVS